MAGKKKESKKPVEAKSAVKTADEKRKAIDDAFAQIRKKYGDGSVMWMGDYGETLSVSTISTGSLTLDIALGVGGLPRGRIIEIFGQESGGKTTVSLHCVAEAQKAGGIAAFIDVEHSLDPEYAKILGVNINDLIVSQPDSGEQALEIMETLIRSNAIDIIVLDSVAAMTTKAEIDGDMGDSHVGLQARLMSSALRKLTSTISKTGTIAIFINQVREKIGGGPSMYGPVEVTTGGRALKFYSTIRIDVRGGERLMDDGEQYGKRTKCKVVKNKVEPPFKLAEFDMIFGKGISKVGELVDLGVTLEIIRKSGAWFYYGEERIGQGRENAKKYLLEHTEMFAEIEAKVRSQSSKITLPEEPEKETSEASGSIDIEANFVTPQEDIDDADLAFDVEDL